MESSWLFFSMRTKIRCRSKKIWSREFLINHYMRYGILWALCLKYFELFVLQFSGISTWSISPLLYSKMCTFKSHSLQESYRRSTHWCRRYCKLLFLCIFICKKKPVKSSDSCYLYNPGKNSAEKIWNGRSEA